MKKQKLNKKKAIAIGEVVLDEIILISDEIILSQKIEKSDHMISIGGPSCAGAVYWSYMGYDITFFSSIGKDSEGEFIADYLNKKNINLIFTKTEKTPKNHVIVELKNGRRTIIRDKVNKPKLNISQKVLKTIQAADIIYLDRHHNYLFEYINENKRKDTIFIFDPSTDTSELNIKILSQINFPIVPWEFVANLHKGTDLSLDQMIIKFYEYLNKGYIVTLGEYGSLIVEKQKITLYPSYKIDRCIDTCGAGDIFRAAFGYALIEGMSLYEAVDFANKVAALQCARIGNITAIPSLEEIKTASIDKNYYNKEDVLSKLKI